MDAPGTRKSLVWTSLFWIPARVPFCHLLPLPRDFLVLVFFFTGLDIWTPVLDFPVLPPCPGFLDFPFFTCSMTTSSPLCGRPFLYLSLAACRLRLPVECDQPKHQEETIISDAKELNFIKPSDSTPYLPSTHLNSILFQSLPLILSSTSKPKHILVPRFHLFSLPYTHIVFLVS